MSTKPLLMAALLGLTGCTTTSGFVNRMHLESRLQHQPIEAGDRSVQKIQSLRPQLQFPCRVAIALQTESDGRWTAKDRAAMDAWAECFRREGLATDVVVMSSMFLAGDKLEEVRASAARYGADAVLLVKGSAATDSSLNPLAVLNLTVVGGFVVPGSRRDALYLLQAGLIDVNNGYLYASMQAEGEATTLGPTFIIEEKDAIAHARESAITAFGGELALRLRYLKAACTWTTAAQLQPPGPSLTHQPRTQTPPPVAPAAQATAQPTPRSPIRTISIRSRKDG